MLRALQRIPKGAGACHHSWLHTVGILQQNAPRLLVDSSSQRATGQVDSRRHFATPQKPNNSFFGRFLDNIREEDPSKKKMRESLGRLQSDIDSLAQSDTAQKARSQYQKIESETAEGAEKARQQLDKLRADMRGRARDSEVLKKAGENMQKMGENISSRGEKIAKTEAYQKISAGAEVVKEELDNTLLRGSGMKVYVAPAVLRLRSERNLDAEQRIFEANPNAQDVVLHKNSRIYESWNNFKDNNKYVNNLMGMKTKLDESDNPLVRVTYAFSEKVTDMLGGIFSNKMSEVLTEVTKVDPNFDIDVFLLDMEYDIIPNVLEAIIRPDLAVLTDWTFERLPALISEQQKALKALGHHHTSRVLDVDNVELIEGALSDDGPLLFFRFKAQMVEFVRDGNGKVVEGSPDQVVTRNYVWYMIRDQSIFEPRAAWKVLDMAVL